MFFPLMLLLTLSSNATDGGGAALDANVNLLQNNSSMFPTDEALNSTGSMGIPIVPSNSISVESIEHDAVSDISEAMFTDPTILSDRHRHALIIVSRLSCTLSGLGSLFIIVTFLTVPKLRKVFALQLVAVMASCELVNACGVLLGSPSPSGKLCKAQSFIVATSGLSSVLWTTVIAFALYTSIVQPTRAISLRKRVYFYHLYVWGVTAALVSLPTMTDSYGFAGFNCWIKSDEVGQFWRFMQFYLPLWLAMLYNLYIYIMLYKTLYSVIKLYYAREGNDSSSSGSTSKTGILTSGVKLLHAMPLLLYPLNLLICWIWGTINRFQNWYQPGHPSYTLFLLQVLFGNLQGFFHFIAYLFSSNVRAIVVNRYKKFVSYVVSLSTSAKSDRASVSAVRKIVNDIFDQTDDDDDDDVDDDGELELTKLLPQNSEDDLDNDDKREEDLKIQLSQQQSKTSLSDVSGHVRTAYVTSLGVYNLIGFDDQQQHQLYHRLSNLEQKSKNVNGSVQSDSNGGSTLSALLNHGHGEKAGTVATYFTLFKSFCGLGVLALPSAFRLAGYVGGTLGIIVIAGISYHCMSLLLDCSHLASNKLNRLSNQQKTECVHKDKVTSATSSSASQTSPSRVKTCVNTVSKSESESQIMTSASSSDCGECVAQSNGEKESITKVDYNDREKMKKIILSFGAIGEIAIGKIGRHLVDVCLVFSQIGFATAYLIFIGSNVYQVANGVGSPATYIFISAAAVVPLVWLKDLKHLALTSLLADVAILFGIVTIFAYDIQALNTAGFDSNAKSLRISTLPLFFGVAVFSFEGVGLILPVQNTMERPEEMPGMLQTTILFLTVLFIAIGAISYMAFGAATADMLFYCLGLFFTYPVMMFPACKILESTSAYGIVNSNLLHRLRSTKAHEWISEFIPSDDIVQRAFRFTLVLVSAVIAVVTPHFTLFVNLIGAVACTMLAFVLPTIFYLKLVEQPSTMLYIRSAAIVLFGITGGLICLSVTLQELYVAVTSP